MSSSRLTFWYYTGIHKCGQCEIGNHEKRYDTLVRWHPWMTENVILTSIRQRNIRRGKLVEKKIINKIDYFSSGWIQMHTHARRRRRHQRTTPTDSIQTADGSNSNKSKTIQ